MRGHFGRWHCWRLLVIAALVFSGSVHADGREDYLLRVLGSSDAFRVRAQAALSLGQIERTERSVAALERAVRDPHPAVRVSAITSLKRLESKRSIQAIMQATKDRNKSVRQAALEAVESLQAIDQRQRGPGEPRYLVTVGMPGAKAERVSRQMLFDARVYLSEQIVRLEGVELAPDDLSLADVKAEIARRGLHGFHIESSIVALEPRSSGVRAVVSIILLSNPGRDMRGMLRGAATATGGYGPETAEQAIQGAFVGALRRLPGLLQAAKTRGSL